MMDYLFWILFFGVGIAWFFWRMNRVTMDFQRREDMGFPREAPVNDDCIEASRMMVNFVADRLQDINEDWMADCKVGMESSHNKLRDSHDLDEFVRYVHLVGCHVKIEQVSDHDIENPENTSEKLKEHHKDLLVENYVRQKNREASR